MFLRRLFFFVILLIIVTACNRASTEVSPPTIHYGEDICEFCGMIISEERFAAGYITRNGEERIFDDLGGMFQLYLQKQEDVIAFFVHDYEDTAWIRAESAHYVLSEELSTPMLSGLAACATSEKAHALATDFGGQVLTFDEVLAYYQDKPPLDTAGIENHHHQ